MARTIDVFDYESLEIVGRIEVDPGGTLLSASGSDVFKSWASENLSEGLVETHSYYHNDCYDRVKAPIPPDDPKFLIRLNMRLVLRGWCDSGLAESIRSLPNFSNHPWRLAHQS